MIGGTAPRAGRPEASRLNQMLGQTVNRCQATPIVVFNPMVMNQAIEMMILMAETTTIAVAGSGSDPGGITNQVNGKCARLASADQSRGTAPEPNSWYSRPRRTMTQTTMPRMVSST